MKNKYKKPRIPAPKAEGEYQVIALALYGEVNHYRLVYQHTLLELAELAAPYCRPVFNAAEMVEALQYKVMETDGPLIKRVDLKRLKRPYTLVARLFEKDLIPIEAARYLELKEAFEKKTKIYISWAPLQTEIN